VNGTRPELAGKRPKLRCPSAWTASGWSFKYNSQRPACATAAQPGVAVSDVHLSTECVVLASRGRQGVSTQRCVLVAVTLALLVVASSRAVGECEVVRGVDDAGIWKMRRSVSCETPYELASVRKLAPARARRRISACCAGRMVRGRRVGTAPAAAVHVDGYTG